MNRRKYFQSRIAAKISRKMLSIYIGIYFLLLIALLLIITPILYRREISSASENLTILKTQYETLLEQIDSSITNLYLADQLNILLDDPAPDTTTVQIEKLLSEYSTKNPMYWRPVLKMRGASSSPHTISLILINTTCFMPMNIMSACLILRQDLIISR